MFPDLGIFRGICKSDRSKSFSRNTCSFTCTKCCTLHWHIISEQSSESQHKDMDFFKKTQNKKHEPLVFFVVLVVILLLQKHPKRIIPVIFLEKQRHKPHYSLPPHRSRTHPPPHQPQPPPTRVPFPTEPTPVARLRSVPWRTDGRDEPSKCPPFGGFRSCGSIWRKNQHLGVETKKGGNTPKWMVKIMEKPIKNDDLRGKPTIFGNTHLERFFFGCPVGHGR